MNRTPIEWVKNPDGTQGYTWNPITGCNNQIDGMCQGGNFPCYAYRLANGRLKDRYLANKNTATQNYDEDSYPFYPRFWEDRLEQILKVPKNSGVFPCDMSDLFGIGIPYSWTKSVLDMMLLRPDCRFYLLTKQPQNLIKFSPFPPHCYVGVTVTRQRYLPFAYDAFKEIDARVKFISFEPLLEDMYEGLEHLRLVDWVIIGAQTNPYKPPEIEWVREIVEACDKAGVAVFLKDNLKPLWGIPPLEDDIILRQELPK